MFLVFRTAKPRLALASAALAAAIGVASSASAATSLVADAPGAPGVETYTLTDAVFGDFWNGSRAEVVSGSWTIDWNSQTVNALSLTATGGETLNYTLSGVQYLAANAGAGQDVQWEIGLNSVQNTQFYLDFQTAPSVKMIATADNGYQSNLFITNGAYSGLASGVPEVSTWAMMLAGFAALGFAGYRRRNGVERKVLA